GPPSPRIGFVMEYDQPGNRVMVFGGQFGCGVIAGCTSSETWVLTNANGTGGTPVWTLLTPASPPPNQYGALSGYDPASNRLIVFAGASARTGANTHSVWILPNPNGTGGTPVWTNLIADGAVGNPPANSYQNAASAP